MKKIFSIIAVAVVALLGAFNASAQEQVTLLTVVLNDGNVERYNLPDKPEITFENGSMFVKSGEMSGEFLLEEVSHFTFEEGDMLAGIDAVIGDDNTSFAFEYVDNANVTVAAPGLQWVAVYTIQGVEVAKVPANNAGVATVSVSHLTPGVYVVLPSCHSAIKIVKK